MRNAYFVVFYSSLYCILFVLSFLDYKSLSVILRNVGQTIIRVCWIIGHFNGLLCFTVKILFLSYYFMNVRTAVHTCISSAIFAEGQLYGIFPSKDVTFNLKMDNPVSLCGTACCLQGKRVLICFQLITILEFLSPANE
jgi:hypothetical protein